MAAIVGLLLQRDAEKRKKRVMRINHRRIRDAANPFELPELTFIKLFRLNKEAARFIINELQPHMDEMKRQTGIPHHVKILCTLHFYGHGSYQVDVGYGGNVCLSQSSVSRAIQQVTEQINTVLLHRWIQFPTTIEELRVKTHVFFEKYQFPDTIGAIDCTHVAICTPPANHPIYPGAPYLNRKGFYSINVQIVVDGNFRIINMNARYPGSVHDAAIWMMSGVNRHLKNLYLNGNMNYHLIGDEGYPLSPWLLIKHPGNLNVQTPAGRFNERLTASRMCVERLNGVLKGRFRCLLKDRTLHYNPVKAAKIIYSCGVLHNICEFFKVPVLGDEALPMRNENDNLYHNIDNNRNDNNFLVQGQRKRNGFVERFFQ